MSAKKRREKEKEARAAAILREAARLFLRRGYDKTSVADVADALDIAKGTVYLYFSTKEDLLAAVLADHGRSVFEKLKGSVSRARSAKGALRTFARAYARSRIDNAEFYHLLFNSMHKESSRGSSHKLVHELVQRHRDILRSIIQKGNDSGEFAAPDVDLAAEHVMALFRGTVIGFSLHGKDYDLKHRMVTGAETLIRGLSAEGRDIR